MTTSWLPTIYIYVNLNVLYYRALEANSGIQDLQFKLCLQVISLMKLDQYSREDTNSSRCLRHVHIYEKHKSTTTIIY